MKKFYESTTAQFGIFILSVGALAAGFSDLTWDKWLESSLVILGIYGTKESVKYGSAAYQNKPTGA